jgi:hypothetical protein
MSSVYQQQHFVMSKELRLIIVINGFRKSRFVDHCSLTPNAAKSLLEFRLCNFDEQLQRRHRFNPIDFNRNDFPPISRNIPEDIKGDKKIREIGEDLRTENTDHKLVDLMRVENPPMCDQPGWKRQS